MSKVLITGGSGFIGSHCILKALAAGHAVHTTVRDLKREAEVRAMLKQGGAEPGDKLRFFAADLESDAGWREAAEGCDFVLHVASPLPLKPPEDENDVVRPAREGTLRVLRASRDAGVKRVVMTSSYAAIGYGHAPRKAPVDETQWTNLDGSDVSPYVKSKTLAERAAWEFIDREGKGLELVAINPVVVAGPALAADYSASIFLVRRLMDGRIPALPRLYFGIVDVRDVADLHLIAMTHPAAAGQRFLAVAGDFISMRDMGLMLRRRMGAAASKVPTRQMPDWLVRLAAKFNPTARAALPELGKYKTATNEKARRVLGWSPRSAEDALVASAESLVQLGLLKNG
jgi:nucleoside-diphosphate-sugar epimerase